MARNSGAIAAKKAPGATCEPPQWDLRLQPDSRAVDAGVCLPNINDDYTGDAPGLGAFELDRPMPHYGPRISQQQVRGTDPVTASAIDR